jgi:hypothetical protein
VQVRRLPASFKPGVVVKIIDALKKYLNVGSATAVAGAILSALVILFPQKVTPDVQQRGVTAVGGLVGALISVVSLLDEVLHTANSTTTTSTSTTTETTETTEPAPTPPPAPPTT